MNQKIGIALLLLATSGTALAQPPASPPGETAPRDREEHRGEGGGSPGGRRIAPLMAALDTDKDGELSAQEIAAAATTLKTLDRNKDGKISADELRPKPIPVVIPPADIVARLMEFDRNGDGKLTRSELPARMKRFFEQADTNHDGVLTEAELTVIITKQENERQAAEQKAIDNPPANPAPAEPRGEGSPGERRPEGRGPGGPGMRVSPLMAALDTNKDGELSPEEIAAASTALKTLDKDGDGKISADETRPPRPAEAGPRPEGPAR